MRVTPAPVWNYLFPDSPLIWQRYVILHLFHRGVHGFEQKFIQAAGVPIFTEHSIAQVIKALNHNAILSGGEVYLEFPFFHRAFLLYAFIIYSRNAVRQMRNSFNQSALVRHLYQGKCCDQQFLLAHKIVLY